MKIFVIKSKAILLDEWSKWTNQWFGPLKTALRAYHRYQSSAFWSFLSPKKRGKFEVLFKKKILSSMRSLLQQLKTTMQERVTSKRGMTVSEDSWALSSGLCERQSPDWRQLRALLHQHCPQHRDGRGTPHCPCRPKPIGLQTSGQEEGIHCQTQR